jgi:hypothetical protein
MFLIVLKYLLYIILVILAIIVMTGFYIYLRNVYDRRYFNNLFGNPSSLSYKLPNGSPYSLDTWMSNVNPLMPINKIVIPGTHDSLTYEWEKSYSLIQQFTAIWAKTQYLTTKQQLLSGVRYVDARCGASESRFGYGKETPVIFHGDLSTNITYEECVNELIEFIDTHPSEIIIWKVRILNTDEIVRPATIKYHSKLNLIPPTPSYFNSTLEDLRNRRPSKTRGGVILMSSNYGDDKNVWPESKVFDPYDFDALMIDKKSWTMSGPQKSTQSPQIKDAPRFQMAMNKIYSNKEVDPNSISVMQMIAEYQVSTKTSLLNSVETISKRINQAILDKDLPPPPKAGYNIIMVDFITPQLSNGIIQFNQPSTFK